MAEEVKEDVKEVSEASAEAQDVNEAVESSTTEDEDLNFVSDESRKIPYARFKEVNSKYKETEEKLSELEQQMDHKVQDAVYRKELELRRLYEDKLSSLERKTDDFSYDDYESDPRDKKIAALESKLNEVTETLTNVSTQTERDRIKKTVGDLKSVYSELDEEHVYSIKRAKPNWSWERCAEYSHNKFQTHMENRWKELVSKKKAASTKRVVGAEGLRNMKPEDKPKTWAEARAKVSQYLPD